MKVSVAIPEGELGALYGEYSRQGGTRTREEVAGVLAQDIIDRYLSPEYYIQCDLKNTIDSLFG